MEYFEDEEFVEVMSKLIWFAENPIMGDLTKRILIRDIIIYSITDEVCDECKHKVRNLIDEYFENDDEIVESFIEFTKKELKLEGEEDV